MSQKQTPQYPLTDPAVLAEPNAVFHQMRQEDPVHWSDAIHGWVLTRYDDVVKAFRDPRLSCRRTQVLIQQQLAGQDPAILKDYARVGDGSMLLKDGEDHRRLRNLGNRGFTPTLLENFRPVVQWVVDSLLDQVQGNGRMDVVADFAQPFPSIIIAELFGIPEEDREQFQNWSDSMAKFFGSTLGDPKKDAEAANAAAGKLERYFLDMLAKRGNRPGADLMGLFIAGQNDGKLSPEEVCYQCVLLLNAGHVTTIDQLSNAVHCFLAHPDELQRLKDNPKLLKSAVEEVLRFVPAVPLAHRIALEDIELRGKIIGKGQMVYMAMVAANRDPEVFRNPDRFDIGRTDNEQLTFGAGPHICLGAGLARRELEIGLRTLFDKMPNIRLDPDNPARRRCESLLFRGFHSLPVMF